MTMLGQMDRLVYATRLDRIIFMKFQPRAFRWTPLLVIAALASGFVLMARTKGPPDAELLHWLAAFLWWFRHFTLFVLCLGPRFTSTQLCPLDERELMVKAQSHAISGVVLAASAMLACFYMAISGLPGPCTRKARLTGSISALGFKPAGCSCPPGSQAGCSRGQLRDHED